MVKRSFIWTGDRVCTATDKEMVDDPQPLWWRRGLYKAIHNDTANFPNKCRPTISMSDIKMPQPDSASNSIMILGKTVDVPVTCANPQIVIKLTFERRGQKRNDSLAVEERIYRDVITKMDMPFCMQYIATLRCRNFDVFAKTDRALYRRWMQLSNSKKAYKYNMNIARFLIIERGMGRALDKIDDLSGGTNEWWNVLIQIVFALAYFEEYGLMHNDLHLGNIWVDKLAKPKRFKLYYAKNQPPIEITTRYLVKIYDFDRSTKIATRANKISIVNKSINTDSLCEEFGTCNKFIVGRDYSQVAWYFYRKSKIPEKVKSVLRKTVNSAFLRAKKEQLAWAGVPCYPTGNEYECANIPNPAMSPRDVLPLLATKTKLRSQSFSTYTLPSAK